MRDKHEVAKGKNCRFCKTVWPGKEDLHAHLVRDHGKTLHLCGDCGNNYANEKSQGTHVKKCPQRNQQPQPQNEGDEPFAPDAREEADDSGFDATLEVKEEEADEDEKTSEDDKVDEEASNKAAATFTIAASEEEENGGKSAVDDDDDEDGEKSPAASLKGLAVA